MQEVDSFGGCAEKKREEVRDWVIQLSMDQQVGSETYTDAGHCSQV